MTNPIQTSVERLWFCRTADGLPVRLLDRSDHVVDRRVLPPHPGQLSGPRRLPSVRRRSADRPELLQPGAGGLTPLGVTWRLVLGAFDGTCESQGGGGS